MADPELILFFFVSRPKGPSWECTEGGSPPVGGGFGGNFEKMMQNCTIWSTKIAPSLSALVGCWSSTFIRRIIYKGKFGNKCILSYHVPVQTTVSPYDANCVTPLIYPTTDLDFLFWIIVSFDLSFIFCNLHTTVL